jgi:hypothetical protein
MEVNYENKTTAKTKQLREQNNCENKTTARTKRLREQNDCENKTTARRLGNREEMHREDLSQKHTVICAEHFYNVAEDF